MSNNQKNNILQKISLKTVKIGIIGLGYVGLPLAVTFAKNKVNVIGFEKDEAKASMVNSGKNYISDVNDSDLVYVVTSLKTFSATIDFSKIMECDAIIICVPTPLDKFKKPDMSYI